MNNELYALSISEGSVFSKLLRGNNSCTCLCVNFSPCIDMVLIFFSYSGPSGLLCSDGGVGGLEVLHFPVVLINRLNKTESAVF